MPAAPSPFHRQLSRLRWIVALGLLAILATGQAIEHFVVRREGLTFIFLYESLFIVLVAAGTWLALTWASRQTARRDVAAARLAALYAIDRAAVQSLDLDEILRDSMEVTAETLGVEAAGIMLLEPDGETLTLHAHWGIGAETVEAVRRMKVGEGLAGQAAAQKSPAVLDVADYPTGRLAPFVAREGFQTMASVPLLAKDRVVGTLTLGTQRPRAFPPEEMDFLVSIGRQLGVAVDNARLYTETKQKSDRLAALNRISQVVASSLELDEVYEAFVQEVAGLVPLDRTSIVFFDEDFETFEVAAAFTRGKPTLMKGTRLPVKGSGMDSLVAERRALLRPDLFAEPPFVGRDALIAQGIRCALSLPLICKDRLIGTVNFASGQPNAYSEEDIALLTSICEQVAVAVENSRLFHVATGRLAEMETLYQFSATLRAAGSVNEMLPVIVDRATRAVAAHAGLLLLRERERMVVRAATEGESWLLGREFHLAGGPAERALLTGQSEVIPDVSADPTLPPEVRARKPPGASGIRLPLRVNGDAIGTMHIGFDGPHPIGPGEARLLTSLADMAAGAIQRAGLYEQLQQELRASKLAEEALRQSEANYRDLFEAAYDAICLLDKEGNFIDVNRRVEALTGYSRTELLNMNVVEEIVIPEDRPLIRKVLQDSVAGKESIYEVRWQTAQGRVIHFEGATTARLSSGGEFLVTRCALRDITERKQHERELEAIAAVSAALRAAQSRAEMMPIILDQLVAVLKVGGAALAMRDPASGETVVELARGELARALRERLPAGEGLSGHVIVTGQPYLNNDVRTDARLTRPDLLGDIRAVACAPLIAQEQTIGALWIGRDDDIAPGEVRLLTAIADMAANAIHRATLHEQTEQRLQRLTALHAIDTAISASLDLRLTLNVLLDQVTEQLNVDAADVLLLDPHTLMLNYAAGRGFRTNAIARSRVRVGEGYAGLAALERRVVAVPNLAEAGELLARAPLLADEGFVAYYVVPLIAKGQVKGVLSIFHRAPLAPSPEWLDFVEALATQAAIAIDNASLFESLQRSNVELWVAYDTTIEGWARALELRDHETEGHTRRVTQLAVQLAQAMGIDEQQIVYIRRGALLHDIGKMGVPDGILLKHGSLTDEEWAIMRRHPQYAYEMLLPIAYLRPALDIPYRHHEKWDGTGYPGGLRGEQIPLAARIFAVVDVWDALRSDRPYRKAWPEEEARRYIHGQSGAHFDPQVVQTFLPLIGIT